MALSKDFEKLKEKCPSFQKSPYPDTPDFCMGCGFGGCSFEHCAVLYWLKHAIYRL